MKKKRFMGLLALASCVTLLTGCDSEAFFGLGGTFNEFAEKMGIKKAENEEQKQEEQKEEEQKQEEQQEEENPEVPVVPEGKLIISPLPEELHKGDVLDLDDYVTLFMIPSFEVEILSGSEFVKLNGHKLSVIGDGEFSFKVTAGKFSETFSYDSERPLKKALSNYFDGVGVHYDVEIYWPVYDDNDKPTGEMELTDSIIHADNYVYDYSDDPWGMLRFGETGRSSYLFEIAKDDEGVESVKLTAQYSKNLINYYNAELGIDWENAKYEYDAEYDAEYYVIEGDDAIDFAEGSMFVPGGAYGQNGEYPFSRIEFELVDIAEEGEESHPLLLAYSYVRYMGKDELVHMSQILVGDDYYSVEMLDQYCLPENAPPPFDYYNDYFEDYKLSDFLVSDESVFGPNGIIYAKYGWVDAEGNPIAQPSDVDGFFGGTLPSGSSTLYTSENSIWNIEFFYDEEGQPESYNILGGKTSVETEEGTRVYDVFPTEDGYYTELDSSANSVWDDAKLTFGGLRDPQNWSVYAISSASSDDSTGRMVYEFEFLSTEYHELIVSICESIEGMALLTETIDLYAEFTDYEDNFENFVDMILDISPDAGSAAFTLSVYGFGSDYHYEIVVGSISNESVVELCQMCEAEVLQYIK